MGGCKKFTKEGEEKGKKTELVGGPLEMGGFREKNREKFGTLAKRGEG